MIGLIYFVMAGLFTPGPNVILLTSSGARFGFGRSLPHLFGVVLGVGIIAGVTALGLGALIQEISGLRKILQIVATGWIIWMAWSLLVKSNLEDENVELPFTFYEAVLFQAVNPKIWAVALAAVSGFSIELDVWKSALMIGCVFSVCNLLVCMFWTYFGTLLSKLLTRPRDWIAFRTVMSLLLALSAGVIWI